MIGHVVRAGGAALLLSAALGGSAAVAQDQLPTSREAAAPPAGDVRARLARVPLPALRSAQDVAPFIDAASAAPVSRREEVRDAIQRTRENVEIANRLIGEFNAAQKTDFSRALVILALIGEQRSATGTIFLTRFLQRPLPRGGVPTNETGVSPQAEAFERLQVKAANALPYARTPQAAKATLDVVKSHPLKPVRVEAASSYLWNAGNSAEARRTLASVLHRDEQMVLDRPVRDQNMTADQFNRQIAVYLDRHPDLVAPSPLRAGRGTRPAPSEPAAPPPPSE